MVSALASLNAEQLAATDSAVYGNVVATMHHLLNAEAIYWSFFSGRFPSWFRPESEPPTLDLLAVWEREVATLWADLTSLPDAGDFVERTRPDGSSARLKAGVVILQTFHHSNVHREQISHVLTALGIDVPDVSGWGYGRETTKA